LRKEYGGKDLNELKTLEDYYLFAKARGYKESWLKFQFEEFKKISWPEFYSQLRPLKNKYENIFN